MLRILIAGWLGLLALPLAAGIPAQRIDQYMALSGIDEMLVSMPGQIEVMIDQLSHRSGNPETERQLMGVMLSAWDADGVRAAVEEYIRRTSSPGEIDSLLAWKVSPLSKQVMAAEMESYSPGFQEALGRYIEGLQANPPDEDTVRAIGRLVRRAHVADLMVESTVQSTRAMALSLIEAGMVDSEDAVTDLNDELVTMRKQLAPRMERLATLMSYYIYRDIPVGDLDRYSDYYESDLGRRELALTHGALEAAMAYWIDASTKTLLAGQRGRE